MWRELVASLHADHAFRPGASDRSIGAVEDALNISLPQDLRDVLRESDGIQGAYGLGLIWPADRLIADNLAFRTNAAFRTLYMPFDNLLFFGDAGNGDQFAFAILDGTIRNKDIFAWDHENDSRSWIAPDVRHYLEWWSDGRIRT